MAMSRGDEDVKEVIKIEEEEVMSGQVTGEEDTDTLAHLVAEMPESDIPRYIGGLMRCQGHNLNYFESAEAAELISSALSFEAEERLEESVAAYRFSNPWV